MKPQVPLGALLARLADAAGLASPDIRYIDRARQLLPSARTHVSSSHVDFILFDAFQRALFPKDVCLLGSQSSCLRLEEANPEFRPPAASRMSKSVVCVVLCCLYTFFPFIAI